MTDWIPVGERLPTCSQILITFQHKRGRRGPAYVGEAFYGKRIDGTYIWTMHCNGQQLSFTSDKSPVRILAWMPLPEPYQPPK